MGLRCPKCKQSNHFAIEYTDMVYVDGDGDTRDTAGNIDWADTSYCRCDNEDCEYEGHVGEFEDCYERCDADGNEPVCYRLHYQHCGVDWDQVATSTSAFDQCPICKKTIPAISSKEVMQEAA